MIAQALLKNSLKVCAHGCVGFTLLAFSIHAQAQFGTGADSPKKPKLTPAQIRAALEPMLSCEWDVMQALRDPSQGELPDPKNPAYQTRVAQLKKSELALEAIRQSAQKPDEKLAPAAQRDDGVTRLQGPLQAFGLGFERANLLIWTGMLVELHSSRLQFDAVKRHLESQGWVFEFMPEMSDSQPFLAYRSSRPLLIPGANSGPSSNAAITRVLILTSAVVEGYNNRHMGPGVSVRCATGPAQMIPQ